MHLTSAGCDAPHGILCDVDHKQAGGHHETQHRTQPAQTPLRRAVRALEAISMGGCVSTPGPIFSSVLDGLQRVLEGV